MFSKCLLIVFHSLIVKILLRLLRASYLSPAAKRVADLTIRKILFKRTRNFNAAIISSKNLSKIRN